MAYTINRPPKTILIKVLKSLKYSGAAIIKMPTPKYIGNMIKLK
jgi:hypothetical protein